jgi:ribonuclease HI
MNKKRLVVFSDGGARGNPGPAASSFVVFLEGREIKRSSKYLGETTNNVAEYFGVLLAMKWISKSTVKDKVEEIVFNLDSQLVARQLSGIYKVKESRLKLISSKIKILEKSLNKKILFNHIPREQNKLADKLVNETIDENSV